MDVSMSCLLGCVKISQAMLHDAQSQHPSPASPAVMPSQQPDTKGGSEANAGNSPKEVMPQNTLEDTKSDQSGMDGRTAIPAVAAPPVAAEPAPAAASPKQPTVQDRTLELKGMEALMKQHAQREALAAIPAVAPMEQIPKESVNWVSHKKEGMRLKRLMEESSEGSKFPHMQQLWGGSAADSLMAIQFIHSLSKYGFKKT